LWQIGVLVQRRHVTRVPGVWIARECAEFLLVREHQGMVGGAEKPEGTVSLLDAR